MNGKSIKIQDIMHTGYYLAQQYVDLSLNLSSKRGIRITFPFQKLSTFVFSYHTIKSCEISACFAFDYYQQDF